MHGDPCKLCLNTQRPVRTLPGWAGGNKTSQCSKETQMGAENTLEFDKTSIVILHGSNRPVWGTPPMDGCYRRRIRQLPNHFHKCDNREAKQTRKARDIVNDGVQPPGSKTPVSRTEVRWSRLGVKRQEGGSTCAAHKDNIKGKPHVSRQPQNHSLGRSSNQAAPPPRRNV